MSVSFYFSCPFLCCFVSARWWGMRGGLPGSEKWPFNNSGKLSDIFSNIASPIFSVWSVPETLSSDRRWGEEIYPKFSLLFCFLFCLCFCAICWIISLDPFSSCLISVPVYNLLFNTSGFFVSTMFFLISGSSVLGYLLVSYSLGILSSFLFL